MSKSITIHTLVQNEEKYLWFSVMSVIDFVDKIFIWDTGSTDKTIGIIKEIEKSRPGKVYFKEVGKVDVNEFTLVRQKMLEETQTDWFILVDGDEVWWQDSIRHLVSVIKAKGDGLDTIVNKYTNLIGDIYHFQDETAGMYMIDSKIGFFNTRAVNRKIDGLNVAKPHGQQGFFNKDNVLIQNMDQRRRGFINKPSYLHFTNLSRSAKNFDFEVPKRNLKYKYELGKSFPLDFYYPEVFFREKPDIVSNPWLRRGCIYMARASIETPLKLIKRKLLRVSKSGY